MKKLLPAVLSVIMVITMMPQAAFAVTSQSSDAMIIDNDTVWNDQSFDGDVYVAEDATLTTSGSVKVNGSMYVYGSVVNEGTLEITGTLSCLHFNSNGQSLSADTDRTTGIIRSVSNASTIQSGTLDVSTAYLNRPFPEHTHKYSAWSVAKAPTCTTAGSKIRTCSICKTKETSTIPASGHKYKTSVKKATFSANGSSVTKCTECGTVKTKTAIRKVSKVSLSKKSATYTGKAIKPSVTIKDSSGKALKKNTDYTLRYSSNKNVGKAVLTVTLKGRYSGTKKLTYKINPKGTSLSPLKSGKKSFTAKWKKQSKQTSGYQLKYSASSSFSGAKTVTVSGSSKTSKTIKGLKNNKKYYAKVRTYKTVKGTKYYSGWSKAKSVKTKKVSKPSGGSSHSNTVYITYTGSKYHFNKNCRGLARAKAKIKTTLSEAKAEGYTLCGYEK